jgi:uncharacterized protein (TIGR02246 family)
MRTTGTEHPATPASSSPGIDPALAGAWAEFSSAFNRHDVREVATFFEEGGSLIGPAGDRGDGRSEVERVLAVGMERLFRGTTSRFTIQSVRKLGRGLALVDVEHAVQGARMPDGSQGTRKLHVVVVARRRGDTWRWVDVRPYAFLPGLPEAPLH